MPRESARKVFGLSSRQKNEDKEIQWWTEQAQGSIQVKSLAKKMWNMQGNKESRQENWEAGCMSRREVAKAKEKKRMDTEEGKTDLY